MPIYFRSAPVNEPFTFDSAGNHWKQERVFRPKGYPLYHYLLTEKGRGRIEIQGKSYILNEGEGVLIAPFISHSYSGETEEWITSFATITGTIESSIAKMLKNRALIFTEKEQAAGISRLISDAIEKYENTPTDARALSFDCYALLMNFVDGICTADLMSDPLYERYIAPVMKEIETNFSSRLTVQELSSLVYVTPQYLSRLFRRFLGRSAHEYLTTFRINKAKELLLTGHRAEVQTIAQQVGFEDPSHFIAMFKKRTGVTPTEFRVLYRLKF